MPILSGQLAINKDEELRRARDELAPLFEGMVSTAQRDGLLRADVAPGDIGLMVIRIAHPLPGPFPRPLDDSLAHRHLDLLLAGLRATGPARPEESPPGRALTLEDLRRTAGTGEPLRESGS